MYVPEGFATVTPYLFVDDAEAFGEFVKTALGGREVGRTSGPDGTVANLQIRIGDATLMISEASDRYPAMPSAFYLFVDAADAAMARAIQAGANLEMEVMDMSYDDRQGGVRDPFGNLWWISQRLVDKPYH